MDKSLSDYIPADWKELLSQEVQDEYFQNIEEFLDSAKDRAQVVHPSRSRIFHALASVPLDKLKVIILGQDPYHGQGQAMGLSFSVPQGIKIPPSLRNIFKELMTDIGTSYPTHGDLSKWSEQGVLLLNAILTVEHSKPASHAKIGWERFTDALIRTISEKKEHLVFMLWGNFARSKKNLINAEKHLILEAAHPSPLARNKFQNCKHFSKANSYLKGNEIAEVNWKLD